MDEIGVRHVEILTSNPQDTKRQVRLLPGVDSSVGTIRQSVRDFGRSVRRQKFPCEHCLQRAG